MGDSWTSALPRSDTLVWPTLLPLCQGRRVWGSEQAIARQALHRYANITDIRGVHTASCVALLDMCVQYITNISIYIFSMLVKLIYVSSYRDICVCVPYVCVRIWYICIRRWKSNRSRSNTCCRTAICVSSYEIGVSYIFVRILLILIYMCAHTTGAHTTGGVLVMRRWRISCSSRMCVLILLWCQLYMRPHTADTAVYERAYYWRCPRNKEVKNQLLV